MVILKNQKQKFKWIAVAVGVTVLAVLVLGLGVRINRTYQLPESHVEITGAIVDNRYNNYIAENNMVTPTGDFVRIGDKLYYNYYGTYETYGLYEITSNGAQRIYWDGYCPWAFLRGYEITCYPIQAYGGKLLMNTIVGGDYYVYNNETWEWELTQGRMQTYCEESHTFEAAMLFGGIMDIKALMYQETSFGFVYESSAQNDLWVYTEKGGPERIVAEDVLAFYTVGTQIYYMTISTPKDPYILRVFDWDKKTDSVICEWTDYTNMTNIMIEDGSLIFVADNPDQNIHVLCKLDLNNPAQKEEAIYTIDRNSSNIISMNVWNGMVYLCTEDGLIACDLDTTAQRILCDKCTSVCYIVDDTWVYFVEKGSPSLWRIPQSGGEVELVLG